MKTAMRRILAVAVLFGLTLAVQAQDKKEEKPKEVTLKGTICCTMCELNETKACGTCIKVKEGDKEVTYYFDDKGKEEKYHETICGAPKKGSVMGVVSTKDKKKMIKPSKDGVKFE
jgi:hypothetical protein